MQNYYFLTAPDATESLNRGFQDREHRVKELKFTKLVFPRSFPLLLDEW